MEKILQLFIWIPLLSFLTSIFIPRKKESALSGLAILTAGLCFTGMVSFTLYWMINGSPILDIKHITLFEAGDIQIFIDFFFDQTTAVFGIVGSLITFLVTMFSRFYLHRDHGFKLFFSVILLFFLSYNLIVFSGNFETLFIGWEILGVCSFLLIAFYRDRYLPVKNSLKVISIYRFGDICLILAMWMSHHLWHENITFLKLNDTALVKEHLIEHSWYGFFIPFMILVAAAAKSAQLPFSSWLPRAMEGPTSSSAIFYGSLSVHLGVFLLLRTYPYWESLLLIKILIVLMGMFTALIATGIAKVQSSVKTQIAYSSIAQIGLMFIEVALGFHTLALIHFIGNAFLRTYQLLVSPSVLSYLIHDMVFNLKPEKQNLPIGWMGKLKNTFYVLSIKEWNLDLMLYRFLWNPFKILGRKLDFLKRKTSIAILAILFIIGAICDFHQPDIDPDIYYFLPNIYSFISLMLVLYAFSKEEVHFSHGDMRLQASCS
jgi:NADH-quinone oxidoreductase subunit L